MIELRALISGFIPRRTMEYMVMESVLTPAPVVKKDMTKSSMDRVKARIAPVTTPGMISGRTTFHIAFSGGHPRSSAAS